MGNMYRVSMVKQLGFDVYFTDDSGYASLKDGQLLSFKELPKPLLKQIK